MVWGQGEHTTYVGKAVSTKIVFFVVFYFSVIKTT
jgi:hypothetical protein